MNTYIYGDENADSLVAEFTHYEPEVDSANALLIAAAPDLLEVLILMTELEQKECDFRGVGPSGLLLVARTAIAKATGQPSGLLHVASGAYQA